MRPRHASFRFECFLHYTFIDCGYLNDSLACILPLRNIELHTVQFINIFFAVKDITSDLLKWGDEVEYAVDGGLSLRRVVGVQ